MTYKTLSVLFLFASFFCVPAFALDAGDIDIFQTPQKLFLRLDETVEVHVNVVRSAVETETFFIKEVTPPKSRLLEQISASQESSSLIKNNEKKLLQTFKYQFKAIEKGQGELSPFVLEFHSSEGEIVLSKGTVSYVEVVSVWKRYQKNILLGLFIIVVLLLLKTLITFVKKTIKEKRVKTIIEQRKNAKAGIESDFLNELDQLGYLLREGKQKEYLIEIRSHLKEYFQKKYSIDFSKEEIVEKLRDLSEKEEWLKICRSLDEKIEQISYVVSEMNDSDLKRISRKITNQVKKDKS